MPGEPCGKDTCISYEELEKLRRNARIGKAVRKFAKEWRVYYEETGKHFQLSELEDVILRAEKGEFKNE